MRKNQVAHVVVRYTPDELPTAVGESSARRATFEEALALVARGAVAAGQRYARVPTCAVEQVGRDAALPREGMHTSCSLLRHVQLLDESGEEATLPIAMLASLSRGIHGLVHKIADAMADNAVDPAVAN